MKSLIIINWNTFPVTVQFARDYRRVSQSDGVELQGVEGCNDNIVVSGYRKRRIITVIYVDKMNDE